MHITRTANWPPSRRSVPTSSDDSRQRTSNCVLIKQQSEYITLKGGNKLFYAIELYREEKEEIA
jgi:hypothetical protein